jgi:hypothetical protein
MNHEAPAPGENFFVLSSVASAALSSDWLVRWDPLPKQEIRNNRTNRKRNVEHLGRIMKRLLLERISLSLCRRIGFFDVVWILFSFFALNFLLAVDHTEQKIENVYGQI